jgi:coenzyme F420-0:L-glutamate ligase/coenzyme F420-1:gamma-L-glutamate ligase
MSAPEPTLQILGIRGIGEIQPGDDLGATLIAALAATGLRLQPDDVIVVSSKVISKAEGRLVPGTDRDEQISAETVRTVAVRRTPRGLAQIVEAAAGPVMAAAGVDNSNVTPGMVLLLPKDPDDSARALRARLHELTGLRLGVILSDTAGRAWRDGQTDFALGCAGLAVTDDLRGAVDTFGQPLEVTVRALVDEIAAAADLVKGKLTAIPAAIVRGPALPVIDDDGPGAAALLRPAGEDWFRYGHVEAVRASLGVEPGDVEPPTIPVGSVSERLARALDVAQAGNLDLAVGPAAAYRSLMVLRFQDGGRAELKLAVPEVEPWHWAELGALAQRVQAAAWSEDLVLDLAAELAVDPALAKITGSAPVPVLRIQARPGPVG